MSFFGWSRAGQMRGGGQSRKGLRIFSSSRAEVRFFQIPARENITPQRCQILTGRLALQHNTNINNELLT